jgi:hypothetical protein
MKRRRLKLVYKRKAQADDLSFMPPYSEQARYIALANTFLASNGFGNTARDKVADIDGHGSSKSKNKKAS